jgi:hypothetical protein
MCGKHSKNMLIVITNKANSVRLDYNDVIAPNIFSKSRTIMKAAIMMLRLAHDESYIEIVYHDGSNEQFNHTIFEGMNSNQQLYNLLDSYI